MTLEGVSTSRQLASASASACGVDWNERIPIVGGRMLTKGDVAQATSDAYLRQRKRFPVMCGAKRRDEKKRLRALKMAVKDDVAQQLGLSIPDNAFLIVATGIAMFILGGPIALVVSVLSVLFEYLVNKDLESSDAMSSIR